MAVTDFTAKVYGTVAYDDNTHGSFESSATWRGNLGGVVATHTLTDSQNHFRQLLNGQTASINQLFAILPGTVTVSTPAPTTQKTVSSFVMEISGTVTEDDNTIHFFLAQWVNGALDLFPSETDTAWALITASITGTSFLDQVLEAVAGTGNVTISA